MRTFINDRGFLTFAQNGNTDYTRLAYAAALSIKATQRSNANISMVVTPGTLIPDKYKAVFDEIIDVPWIDEARQSKWKLENEWKAYHITPYRETIKIDADMLFPTDISEWWNCLSTYDLLVANNVRTYRGHIVANDFYRKTFTANDLPNGYSALTYFKFSDIAQQVFEMMELIFHNWEHFFYEYLDDTRPTEVSTDVVLSLAIKLLDLEEECASGDFFHMCHMKSKLQEWPVGTYSDDWTKHIDFAVAPDLRISVGRYRQYYPFHYHVKTAMTDKIIETYEKYLGI